MFQVIEYARMMVGTKAIGTAVGRLPRRAGVRQGAGAGRRPAADARQDRPARHHHPPPRRAPQPDAAEGVRRGPARGLHLHGDLAGPDPRRRRVADVAHRRAGQRPAAADRQGRRVRAGQRAARCSRCRPSAARATCRTTRSSSTSATPRSTRCTRAPRPSSRWTSCSARSSATTAPRWASSSARSRRSSTPRRATGGSRRSARCSPPRSPTCRACSAALTGHLIARWSCTSRSASTPCGC